MDKTENMPSLETGMDRTSSPLEPDVEKPSSAADHTSAANNTPAAKSTTLSGSKLVVALFSLYSCMFLVALDQLILASSAPYIVSDFKALDDIAWITTSYFLAQSSFMLVFGRMVTFVPVKALLYVGIVLFEAGSAICGAAPNINVLLFGRTLAGVGAAGIYVTTFSTITHITLLQQRASAMGFASITFALSSIIGPLVGGVFADSSATWRWCFYINLPIGAVAAIGIVFIIPWKPAPPPYDGSNRTGWRRASELDFVGCLLVMGTTVCFLVPLTTGGETFAWNSVVVLTLFPLSAVLLGALLLWCRYRGRRAVLSLFLLSDRSMAGACLHSFFIWGSVGVGSVYLPYWYQAIKGSTATHSAIQILPYTISMTLSAALVGVYIGRTGAFWPFLSVPPLLTVIGYALIYTLNASSSVSKLYGFQVVAAVGLGAGMQQNMLVPQVLYKDAPAPMNMGLALIGFLGLAGRSVSISISATVLLNDLRTELRKTLPDAPPEVLSAIQSSISAVKSLPPQYKQGAILAYAAALKPTLIVVLPFAACAILGGLMVKQMRVVKVSSVKPEAEINVKEG